MAGTVQGPLTDLERAKYASDSTLTSSIVQTRQQGGVELTDHAELVCLLSDILKEMKKTNMYFALITDETI